MDSGCIKTKCNVNKLIIVWVSDFYDIELHGLCTHNGSLCEFKTDYETNIATIYSLSFIQKTKWLIRKRVFEICVGYFWSYKNDCYEMKFKKPTWFGKIVFNLYYDVFSKI